MLKDQLERRELHKDHMVTERWEGEDRGIDALDKGLGLVDEHLDGLLHHRLLLLGGTHSLTHIDRGRGRGRGREREGEGERERERGW